MAEKWNKNEEKMSGKEEKKEERRENMRIERRKNEERLKSLQKQIQEKRKNKELFVFRREEEEYSHSFTSYPDTYQCIDKKQTEKIERLLPILHSIDSMNLATLDVLSSLPLSTFKDVSDCLFTKLFLYFYHSFFLSISLSLLLLQMNINILFVTMMNDIYSGRQLKPFLFLFFIHSITS